MVISQCPLYPSYHQSLLFFLHQVSWCLFFISLTGDGCCATLLLIFPHWGKAWKDSLIPSGREMQHLPGACMFISVMYILLVLSKFMLNSSSDSFGFHSCFLRCPDRSYLTLAPFPLSIFCYGRGIDAGTHLQAPLTFLFLWIPHSTSFGAWKEYKQGCCLTKLHSKNILVCCHTTLL